MNRIVLLLASTFGISIFFNFASATSIGTSAGQSLNIFAAIPVIFCIGFLGAVVGLAYLGRGNLTSTTLISGVIAVFIVALSLYMMGTVSSNFVVNSNIQCTLAPYGYLSPTQTAGVFATNPLKNDTSTTTLLKKYLDANDLLVFRYPDDFNYIGNYTSLAYTIVQGRSFAEVQNCAAIPANATWPNKPKYCNYDDEVWTFTPASEQANPAGAVHNASVAIHASGLKMSWSPVSGFSTLVPWVEKINLTDVDLWILQTQSAGTNNPTLFGSVQYFVNQAIKYKNATTPSFVTHIVPNNGATLNAKSSSIAFNIAGGVTVKSKGGTVAPLTVSGTCASRSTILSMNTGFAGGNNILIAPHEFLSSDVTGKTLMDRLYRGTTLLSTPPFTIPIKDSGTTHMSMGDVVLYLDVGAPANANYTLEACTSANQANVTASLMALSGIANSAFGNGTTQTLTGNVTKFILNKTTTQPAGNNIVLVDVMIKNGANAQTINVGDLKLLNGANATIASNTIPIILSSSANAEKASNIKFMVALDSGAGLNPTYRVTLLDSKASLQAEARMLIFSAPSSTFFDDHSLVSLTAGAANEVSRLTTTFAPQTNYAVISTTTIQNSAGTACAYPCLANSAVQYPTYFGHQSIDESDTMPLQTNTQTITPVASGGNAGESAQNTLIFTNRTTTHNPNMVVVPQFSLILSTPTTIAGQHSAVATNASAYNLIYANRAVSNGSSTIDNLRAVIQNYEGVTYTNATCLNG